MITAYPYGYFHYYRIRKLLRNLLFYLCFNLCECFDFVGKGIKETFSKKTPAGIPVGAFASKWLR